MCLMALVDCPKCRKKISNKAKQCSHCGIDLGNFDAEQSQQLAQVSNIEKHQKIMNQSFVAMLLFCGGFLFTFWQNPEVGSTQQIIAISSTVVGFSWYIINRMRLIVLKRK